MAKDTSNRNEAARPDEALTLEKRFTRLDEILAAMDDGEVSLEEAFSLYEQGMRLLKETNEGLAAMEARVEQMTVEGGFEEFFYEE